MHGWPRAGEGKASLRKKGTTSGSPKSHHLWSPTFPLPLVLSAPEEVPKSPTPEFFCSVHQQEPAASPKALPQLHPFFSPKKQKRRFWEFWRNSPKCPLISEMPYITRNPVALNTVFSFMGSPFKRQIPHLLSISEVVPQNAGVARDFLGYS